MRLPAIGWFLAGAYVAYCLALISPGGGRDPFEGLIAAGLQSSGVNWDLWLTRAASLAAVAGSIAAAVAVFLGWRALHVARGQLETIQADQRRIADHLSRRPDIRVGIGDVDNHEITIPLPPDRSDPTNRAAVLHLWVGNRGTRSATDLTVTVTIPDDVEPDDDPLVYRDRRLNPDDVLRLVHRPENKQYIASREARYLHPNMHLVIHLPLRFPPGSHTYGLDVAVDCTDTPTMLATITLTVEPSRLVP